MMPLLECRALSARYGAIQALSGIDVDVEDGEIVCLLGSNGAGKSTSDGRYNSEHRGSSRGLFGLCAERNSSVNRPI